MEPNESVALDREVQYRPRPRPRRVEDVDAGHGDFEGIGGRERPTETLAYAVERPLPGRGPPRRSAFAVSAALATSPALLASNVVDAEALTDECAAVADPVEPREFRVEIARETVDGGR
ncbi:hypothetical protein C464_15655 [Halorubrum coriense DSM 10284]|uniref:Uncharacterized protein n=1 Tax=Halorubrum coriense DSM 10284 TaxID=1227466 RepID=M0EBN1_9EURY|nr:hypothetical protein C464_15655 [Halorubrum coriense DSM 10284]